MRQDDPRQPAEGRHSGGLTASRLGIPELFVLARQDRPDHGMVGLVRLQQRHPRRSPRLPPGPPRHLAHQLKAAFGGAQVGALQSQVRIDHAHQCQAREVVALGDDLRADDDVGVAFGDLGDGLLQRACRMEQVRGQDRGLGVGETRGHLLGDAFHAGTDGGQLALDAAGRTGQRVWKRCSTIRASH